MQIRPQPCEDWKQILDTDELAGTAVVSDPVVMADHTLSGEGLGAGCTQAFLEVVAGRGAGEDDDLYVEVLPVPGAAEARRATYPAINRTITLATSADVRHVIPINWEDVGDAFAVRLSRDGSTDTLTATVSVRRYRYANG